MIAVIAVAVSAGLLVWAVLSTLLKVRHWYEDERDRWRDFFRELRQFGEKLEPVMLGVGVALVAGFIAYLKYVSN